MAPPAPGAARAAVAPSVVERTLSNGMRVIVAKSTDLPIMNAQLIIGGGAAADPTDRPGVASMTADLATAGAGGRTAPQIASTMEALGANIGGGADADITGLSLSTPIASADQAGAVFADVVRNPTFAAEEVERSRTRRANALRVNLRQPGPVASLVLNRLAFGEAAYGAPSSGTPASIGAITRDEIVAFHQRWWRPDNATMIITGGMEPEEAFAFAERTLGGWTRPSGAIPTLGDRAGAVPAPRLVVVDLPGAGQAAVSAAVRGPRRADDSFYPLSVVNSIMGQGQNGHLFQEIRAKRGLSYGAYSTLGARRDGGLLAASTQTKNESAAEVVGLVLHEFDRLRTEAVTDQAVTDREAFINGGFSRGLETTGGLGGTLANAVTYGLPLSVIETYPASISANTPDTVRAAAQAVSSEQAYVVVVGEASMFIDALREAHPDVVVIPAAELDLDSPTLGL